MTVKLLCDRLPYKAGNLYTSDANTEAGLIALHEATATLTGGTTYTPPAPQRGSARARTAAQLAAAPTVADISMDGEYYLDTDPTQRYVINVGLTAYVTFGGSGGAVSSVAGKTGAVTLAPSDVGAIGTPQNWNGTTPALVSSTNPVPAFGTNAFIYNGGTSATLDGLTFNPTDMALFVGGVYTKVILGGGYVGSFATAAALQTASPAASNPACTALVGGIFFVSNGTAWIAQEPATTFGATGNQTLTSAQNNQVIPTSTNTVLTVNTGLLPVQGFGCACVGAGVVTFAGSASVLDKRTTGAANPAFSLIPMGTDIYWAVGSKA